MGAMRAKTSTTSVTRLTGRKLDDDFFVRLGEAWALLGYELGISGVEVAVDEVADDFDVAGNVESLISAVAKIAGDSGDAVGLVDAELGDGKVAAVEANEGDVGPVERGDEGKMFAAGGEHLAREQCADAVRNGVVDVEEVERVELSYFGHAGGQGEVVGWVLE